MRAFIKFVVVIVLAGLAVFEIGSPLWGRSDATGAARDAASVAARDYFQSGGNLDAAKAAATKAAEVRGATLTHIAVQADGSVTVTVRRQAKSYVLHNISALKNWYNVSASATEPPLRA